MILLVTPSRLWLRYLAIGMGVFILLWLPTEDTSERNAIIIALTICTLAAIRILSDFPVDNFKQILFHSMAGSLAGAATILVTIFLIAFKSGLHDHGFSDYSISQINHISSLAPHLIASGLLLALSSAVWRYSRRR